MRIVIVLLVLAMLCGCPVSEDDDPIDLPGEYEYEYEDDSAPYPWPPRQMEKLDRGLVGIKIYGGVRLFWRYFGTDDPGIAFNIYRDGEKINAEPVSKVTHFTDKSGTVDSSYQLAELLDGAETMEAKNGNPVIVKPLATNYRRVPLQIPPGGTTPSGESYTYSANDASVGDMDGDGEYEIVLKWDPSNAKDNSQDGYTGNTILDCYKLDGTRLWRIDLGINIRSGAHYTQFMVYDLDGDGKAEVVCKTADGTKDGTGRAVGGNPAADNRNSAGHILSGNEYLTAFNGFTGAEIDTVNYLPQRSILNMNNSGWGDTQGNRSERYLACVAYLDGVNPSVVMCRGYYSGKGGAHTGGTFLAAWRLIDGRLVQGARFYSTDVPTGDRTKYLGQGNHGLSAADIDGDGKDEIIYGAIAFNSDLTPMYATGLGHGDAQHVGDFIPSRPGLEIYGIHENPSSYGMAMRDALTGAVLSGSRIGQDTGRGLVADIDPRYEGSEYWSSGSALYAADGKKIGNKVPSMNFAVWWDGDVLRELLDGITVQKWDYKSESLNSVLMMSGTSSNNGSKSTPALTADLYGDWREEIIMRETDSAALRIYSTIDETNIRLYTLMHNPQYRLSVAWQNVAYNQPPHVSYRLGAGMKIPRQPNIITK